MARKIRVLIAKPGLDGHDRGAKVICPGPERRWDGSHLYGNSADPRTDCKCRDSGRRGYCRSLQSLRRPQPSLSKSRPDPQGENGVDLVGLPDNAVRESRERVRVAIRNSAFKFPIDRILVSLAPAAIRKEGASFDLPIALGILAASGQVGPVPAGRIMVVGELTLSGSVRPVRGTLSAVAAGLAVGIDDFIVPAQNVDEARALGAGRIHGIVSLTEAARLYTRIAAGEDVPQPDVPGSRRTGSRPLRYGCI